eukprot:TRINITY_DN4748_c0_g2_i1.p1 TRINITY_DN4748_c0_g2~~TRINITY_DN4748_c0_g2_i1.p1  ORF type:complete len:1164 (+),score=257.65 TRINITY_DN4748_c0_g2_i1:141-3632(+)
MTDATVNFSVLCDMLEAISRSKKTAMKRKNLRTFLEHVYTGREYFSAMRLLMPHLDRERKPYKLKEAQLAKAIIDALGLSKESEDAQRLLNWRKGGSKAGAYAGNFPLIATEILSRRQQSTTGSLKIKDINILLDKLADTESREDKTNTLAELINKTNAKEMKWILMIILKDLRMGISEKSILHEFHPDAEDMFNVTCDLKLVCEKLKDKNERIKRQDIEVGKAVRPQLASRVPDVETAWKKLHGKRVLVECKFDGDRIQVHKNGTEVHYFSRNFFEHTEYEHGMTSIILENVRADKCILDGEMLVWDASSKRFAEFGANQEIAKAAKDGLESNQQLCYVVFDILYANDTSVIHKALHERLKILKELVNPVKGRLEILLPQDGIDACRRAGQSCRSFIAQSIHEVAGFFNYTVENRDEGIILKDLDSKWEPSDRSGKWIKLKPDYVNAGSDIDALIIGGYFGSGRRGGEVAQFLLGLAEKTTTGGYPTRFVTFCRVGNGLSDEESDILVNKLKPYFRRNDKQCVPSFYTATNNSKERPDVWIDRPEKSVILEITGDVRMIKTEVFASPYTLRFPRVCRVRYDKPWHDCLDVQAFIELVQSKTNSIGPRSCNLNQQKPKRTKQVSRGERKALTVVPSHMLMTDISGVKRETLIFKDMTFYIANLPLEYSLDQFHKIIVENGGSFSMNWNDTVTHTIAAEKRGYKYQAAAKHGDVIHYSWIIDCCKQKSLLPLLPKYYLSLSDSLKQKRKEDTDEFGDPYFLDIDALDLKQLFGNLERSKVSEETGMINFYKTKYSLAEKWSLFKNCSVYFHQMLHSINADSQIVAELTLRRLKVEISMYGGLVTSILQHATHVIVYSTTQHVVPFKFILSSLSAKDRRQLERADVFVLSHLWMEDSLSAKRKLPESSYNMKCHNSYYEPSLIIEDENPSDSGAYNLVSNKQHQPTVESRNRKSEVASANKVPKRKSSRQNKKPAAKKQKKVFRCHSSSEESKPLDQDISNGMLVSVDDNPEQSTDVHKRSWKQDLSEEENKNKIGGTTAKRRDQYKRTLERGRHGEEQSEDRELFYKENGFTDDHSAKIEETEKNDKVFSRVSTENTEDPVQAMLFEILPNYDSKNPSLEGTSPVGTSESLKKQTSNVTTSEKLSPKKKKVSYKNIVGHLLNDT